MVQVLTVIVLVIVSNYCRPRVSTVVLISGSIIRIGQLIESN